MKNALQGIYNNWKGLASKAKGNWKSLLLVALGAIGILVLALALYLLVIWILLKGLVLMNMCVDTTWKGFLGVSMVTIAWSILTSRGNASTKE
jgi:hypothetical protein